MQLIGSRNNELSEKYLRLAARSFTATILALLTCFTARAQSSDGDIAHHVELAQRALSLRDFATAAREYKVLIQLKPEDASLYTALGVAEYGLGQFSEALKTLDEAVKRSPVEHTARTFLALTQAALRNCAVASPQLLQAFDSEPAGNLNRLVGLSLLECDESLNRFEELAQVTSKLCARYPDDPDVLYSSAHVYTLFWNKVADRLIEKHPDSYRVPELAGEVFEAQKSYEAALLAYRTAANANATVPELHLRAGQMLLKLGTVSAYPDALVELNKELAINPNSAPAEYSIGEIHRFQRDYADAKTHLQRAAAIDPQFAEPHVGLAQVYLEEHKLQDALKETQIAVKLQPDNAQAHYNLMLAYRQNGLTSQATQEMATFQRLQHQFDASFQSHIKSLGDDKASATQDPPR